MFEFLALKHGVPAILKKMNFGHLVLKLCEILRGQLAINTPIQKLPAVVRLLSRVVETGPLFFLDFFRFRVVRITLYFKVVAGRPVLEILLLDVGDEQHFPLPLFFLDRTEWGLRHPSLNILLSTNITTTSTQTACNICSLLFIITTLSHAQTQKVSGNIRLQQQRSLP